MNAVAGLRLRMAGWAALAAVIAPFALFALDSAGSEVLYRLGLAMDVRERLAPVAFVIHAFAGTLALVGGLLQFRPGSLAKRGRVHRRLGYAYVIAVVLSSLMAMRMALTFDVPPAARVSFVALAALWLGSTVEALRQIRQRSVRSHKEWMVRSYALTLFFVVFPLWTGFAETLPLPHALTYPVAVTMAWVINLVGAEAWIRRARRGADRRASTSSRMEPVAALPTS